MVASIVFNGRDLSDVTTAVVTMRSAQSFSVQSAAVPGSSKRVITDVEYEPFAIGVRLMLRPEARTSDEGLSALRRRLRAALAVTDYEGATLVLPDEPGLEWRGVYAVDVDSWDSLFEDGEAEVTFESYDPVAYGEDMSYESTSFSVGGTFPAAPVFAAVALAGSAVQVKDTGSGVFVRVERDFAGGERVVIDCGEHAVYVDGALADAAVTLYSDFFSLDVGEHALALEGARDFTVNFTERWI